MSLLPILIWWITSGIPAAEAVERVRYLRPAGSGFVQECEFTLRKTLAGREIESVTGRGKSRLTVAARYDGRDRLLGATATLVRGDKELAVAVAVTEGKVRVRRAAGEAQEFDVSPGVIVTSAPDWTDTFLLCRRYDARKGGKQTFPGLWVHPEQPAQQPTFAIERIGEDMVELAGRKRTFGRHTISLRPNSRYAAWADEHGTMIVLVPLPYKADAANWLVRDGYESSAAVKGLPGLLKDLPPGK